MTIIHDIRDTWRSLARSPYFTIPVVLSLAFAIGTNTAAFSVLNALVLRPLPVQEPDRLFHLTYVGESGSSDGGNYAWFELVRDRTRSFSAAFIHNREGMKVAVAAGIEEVSGTSVSGGYFQGLGISPQLGRLITPADETGAAPNRVAVLSDEYWARRFGSDPAIIGRTIRVDNVPHEVIGITRPEFAGLEVGRRLDIAVPIEGAEYRQGWASMTLLVRLPAQVTPSAAEAELTTLLREFVKDRDPAAVRARFQRVELRSMAHGLATQGGVREWFITPVAAASVILGVMLLLACANWATLLLARAAARRRDMTIRIALGSSRFRLARQSLIESVSLAVAGGALGFAAASWSVTYLPRIGLPADLRVDPDLRVLLFTAGAALVTGFLFAIAPAWLTARIQPHDLRASSRTEDAWSSRMGKVLVVAQVALSATLVIAAAFFGATLRNLTGQQMGFSGDGVVTFALDAEGTGLEGEPLTARHRQILDRLRAIPDVTTATLATVSPLSGNEDGKGFTIPGFVPQSLEDSIAQVDTIGPDYFETFGIPVLRGRSITAADAENAPHVALVSESAARYYFPGVDPIGRRMEIRGSTTLRPEIIGIVGDVMYDDLRRGARRMFYVPFFQRYADGEYVFAVRTAGSADLLAQRIPAAVGAVAPEMPVLALSTIERQLADLSVNERLLATTSGFFGALALILAGIGIYGIVAYTVARRTPEIGVRIALGATRWHLMWQVVRGSIAVVAVGVGIGLALALAASDMATDLLFGLPPTDPRVYMIGAGILLLVGIVSAVPPVLRALRIEPVTALRYE
jgi:predicted permease